jgi:hypothetical protein
MSAPARNGSMRRVPHKWTGGNEPERINTMAAGDVGLFKGRHWTEAPAIHRSPPIAETGETRLLLVLDPANVG